MSTGDKALQAAVAVTRFGLGARPGELAAIGGDARGWLKAQIRDAGADLPQGLDRRLPTLTENSQAFALYTAAAGEARRDRLAAVAAAGGQMAPAPTAPKGPDAVEAAKRDARRPLQEALQQDMLGRVHLGAMTEAGFRERWALFWANYFTVATKGFRSSVVVGPFEREAIRPKVFARFEDLLMSAVTHPGMLTYLNQTGSVGPGSPAGLRRNKGLNENLAREVLELHTIGADAGYSQADVTEFTRALTGWSQGGLNSPQGVGFVFRAAAHEPGERTVLGRRYPEGGQEQARQVLADLCRHPATARRVAHRLAQHFVADDPNPALVARLERAWRDSEGDLAEVAQALVEAPEAWTLELAKLKTPYEFVVSAYRAAGAAPRNAQQDVVRPLNSLGQRPFGARQPNGWSDLGADWAAGDALIKRLTWARSFAAATAPQGSPVELADDVLGGRLSQPVRMAVARAPSRNEAFTLLLMSPEFQRR